MEILQHLSSCMEQILHQPFVFNNLKCLKICSQSVSSQVQASNRCFVLDSSPGATLEMQETVAQSLVVELQVLLEEEKANAKTNMSQMERGEVLEEKHYAKMLGQGKSQEETQLLKVKKMREKIERCLEHKIKERESKYRLIVSKLQWIEKVMEKLPASKRDLL
nr:uncharacterized protein LOC122593449 isoform X2 [Erigeron canadensis]